MKKTNANKNSLEIPEILSNMPSRKPRHRPAANARLPRKKVTLELDVDVIAWLESEARRGGLDRNTHLNKILRQYIINLVGDEPASVSAALNESQRDEVRKLIDETLLRKGFVQHATV